MTFIKNFCLYLFLLLIYGYAHSQNSFKLEVIIKGLKNNSGRVMVQLLDGNNKLVSQKMGMITNKSSDVIFNYLKQGKYAIRYFHDENQDGHLDSNFIGKPTEGYGYSNNVKGKLGEPSFQDIVFMITKDKTLFLYPFY